LVAPALLFVSITFRGGLVKKLAALVILALAGCDPGGCPWTSVSSATVTPASSCLELKMGESGTGGCVDPAIEGQNDCEVALVLPAEHASRGVALTVPPHTSFSYDVVLASGVYADKTFEFKVPAMLGSDSVEIDFTTSH